MPSQNAKPKHLKERRILRCVTMAALGLFALSSCADAGSSSAASQASGEVTPLRLADDYAPAHPFVEYGASVFIDEAEASGVPIDYFPAAQMGTPEDLAVLLETEVLDAGSTAPAYLESKFPLSSVSDLPSDVSDSCVAANAMMDLLGEDGILYQEEFKPRGLRPLWVAVLPGYELQTATKRVETPEDVQGLLIRSAGGALDASTDHIGAQAVSMPGGDAYEAMARHTVDGVGFTYISANQYGLQDVAAYSTDGLNMGSFVLPYVITEDAWKNLTPPNRTASRVLPKRPMQPSAKGSMRKPPRRSKKWPLVAWNTCPSKVKTLKRGKKYSQISALTGLAVWMMPACLAQTFSRPTTRR